MIIDNLFIALLDGNISGSMLEKVSVRLHGIVPDIELRYKAELACDINRLKKEKHAA